jgi:polyhydroxybutyrate depolymerase
LPGGAVERSFVLAGWPDRDYDLALPSSHRCGEPIAVVIVYHGGGGNKENMRKIACPGGDLGSEGCFDRVARAAGMAVVFANGTAARGGRIVDRGGIRTWNAGGGKNGTTCVSGHACSSGVDDVAYTRALLDDLSRRIDVDPRRVYATGFSNGAAMAHRLGCELADRFAAIAPVGGQNQFALAGCAPAARIAVLDIHGTLDRCWPYDGGEGGCLASGRYVSVAETLAGWAARNRCEAAPEQSRLPARKAENDATHVVRVAFSGCKRGNVEHLRVVGGGHYWPDGNVYARPRLLGGTMSRQLDTARAMVAFFAANPKP